MPADVSELDKVEQLLQKYKPQTIIHCAGIAHQKVGNIDADEYLRVNSEATENLAKAAAKTNPPANNNQTVLPISAQGTFG